MKAVDSRRGGLDRKRWLLNIADTGPGFHAGPRAPMASALQQGTQLAQDTSSGSTPPTSHVEAAVTLSAGKRDPRPDAQVAGEGIGLSIVKRLAEILDGTIELDSTQGRGTVFRILFPRHYSS